MYASWPFSTISALMSGEIADEKHKGGRYMRADRQYYSVQRGTRQLRRLARERGISHLGVRLHLEFTNRGKASGPNFASKAEGREDRFLL
jgi:hypothetical protein